MVNRALGIHEVVQPDSLLTERAVQHLGALVHIAVGYGFQPVEMAIRSHMGQPDAMVNAANLPESRERPDTQPYTKAMVAAADLLGRQCSLLYRLPPKPAPAIAERLNADNDYRYDRTRWWHHPTEHHLYRRMRVRELLATIHVAADIDSKTA